MKILAFAASASQKSINKQLVAYATTLIDGAEIEIIDINDYEMPLYTLEREEEFGHLPLAQQFAEKIANADAILISFAEYNGSYSAAYKNLFDWTSRLNRKVFQDKPMVLLSTSPGAGGGKNVLAQAAASMPHFGGNVKSTVSVPSFFSNFDIQGQRLSNQQIVDEIKAALAKLI
jgi:NAD(P)H-dependent FMN reductase